MLEVVSVALLMLLVSTSASQDAVDSLRDTGSSAGSGTLLLFPFQYVHHLSFFPSAFHQNIILWPAANDRVEMTISFHALARTRPI